MLESGVEIPYGTCRTHEIISHSFCSIATLAASAKNHLVIAQKLPR
ncbi:hypothetical protein SAMN05192566_2186 [Methylophilus rhizosphaerae]|uniref:Uncharacterized protein n=1 Tax=Methylophilus rhizosphaerae TaxID=492660 RepID=A0A1G9E613_9PROT|nr:hypothetical protein SAMN05192566_2186 [Methylophilus rhizosphaerae]